MVVFCLAVVFCAMSVQAQAPIGQEAYTFKIYHVNYGFYPIVQAYFRTWDENRDPIPSLNIASIGLQVKGRNYDPMTAIPARQYSIETIERRAEGFRTVFVLDASGTMKGAPFADALTAITRFIEAKRPVDQVAVLAIRDEASGYEVVSNFETNPTLLYGRISDIRCDGQKTRLYDTIGAAIEMCATATKGDVAALDYAVLSTIIVLSDGKDEGSSVSKDALLNRIGQLPIPIPIYSVAFTRQDRKYLLNIEAFSRATFGRYWDLEDTQKLARTMQDIHRINRSDFVVTFRSYVPVDGDSHTFRIGIEYPSGSGNFLFSPGSFDAIQSPAVFIAALKEHYMRLLEQYPEMPGGPFGDAAGAAAPASALPPASAVDLSKEQESNKGAAVPATVAPAEPPADPPSGGMNQYAEWIQNNILMVAVGFAILLLLLGIIIVVKMGGRSGSDPHVGTSSKTTLKNISETDTKTQPANAVGFGSRNQ